MKDRTGEQAQDQAQTGRSMLQSASYWFKRVMNGLETRAARPGITARRVVFQMRYDRFREILTLNDNTLELIAEIEDLLSSGRKFSLDAMARRIRKAAMDVFVMVKDLNQIADHRHAALYESLRQIDRSLEQELAPLKEPAPGRYVVSLREIRSSDAPLVGSKIANLGEIGAACGCATPDGFAVTTEAFLRFMTEGQLWERCERLDAVLELNDSKGFVQACQEIQQAFAATPIPPEVAESIHQAFPQHFDPATRIAVRSSAVGEDTAVSSHAGLYRTELDIDAAHILDAYRTVLASMFCPSAVSYRFQRGLTISDSLMAVGCICMVEPRCAGIMFSRLPDVPDADAIMISAMTGNAQELAAGSRTAETWVINAGRTGGAGGSLLSQDEVRGLVATARKLESHFGASQDIEWVIDRDGVLKILQARPMAALAVEGEIYEGAVSDEAPLLEGGFVACPGVGSGAAVVKYSDEDLSDFPEGAVLVARHSSPGFAQIMNRCAAIVTDIGSPTGHMSSLSREFAIPTIVGLDHATRTIKNGQHVTVDAGACRVFNGIIDAHPQSAHVLRSGDSPALERLRRVARLVTPLGLTDPASAEFYADHCRSLHDVTRYVHEKAFEVMFHYGDIATAKDSSALRLQAKLPISVEVFDVGGGITADWQAKSVVRPEQIASVPMRAFLEGLLEPRIRWDLPRPVSMRGFFSVLGESVAGLPADTKEIGRVSYAIVSDRYMNFSTKAGYHFSTVDTYCGRSINKNYIHFRFFGGAADEARRRRRVRFVSAVASALDFKVQVSGDTLFAALDKYRPEDIQSRLVSLGRLTLCARQLDMLMDNDSSPDFFAEAFLQEEWHKF